MNLIKNASFLDGAQGFTANLGVLSADDQVFGGPGRTALVLNGTPGNGNTMTLSSDYPEGPLVNSGELLDVFVMGKSTIPNLSVKLQVQAGGEVALALREENPGAAMRGVPSTYRVYRSRVVAPSTGQARIQFSATAANGSAHIFAMLKPGIEKVVATDRPRMWTPGAHFSPDLDIPIWPSSLPPFRNDSIQVSPIPVRKGFNGDVARPISSRIANQASYDFKGDMEMNSLKYDTLETFCYQAAEPFWFVRPDTSQLCHAYWAPDGQPEASGGPNTIRRVSVGLILEVV